MFYPLLRKMLFQMDAEASHDLILSTFSKYHNTPLSLFWKQTVQPKPVELLGLTFKNPLGLAAGLDKNGACIDAFGQMGFGFIEIGTITPRPQAGNPKPRLFRLPESQAIINRMGFNNHGVDQLVQNVKASQYDGVLGINIGKNKDTPNEKGKDDYIHCMRKVFEYSSYITVNISSPNTPGLRDLQYGAALDDLLSSLKNEQEDLTAKHGKNVPVLVKIAPDLDDIELTQVAESLLKNHIDGVIATNTTISREKVQGQQLANEAGGLSGLPLVAQSQSICQRLKSQVGNSLPIIGVGGIHSAETAKQRLAAGADLLQVYSSFIYQGPALIKDIVDHL